MLPAVRWAPAETPGDLGQPAAMLGLLKPVDDRSLQVAHSNLLLLGHPVFDKTEQMLALATYEPELYAHYCQRTPGYRCGHYNHQLGLSQHTVDIHRGSVSSDFSVNSP